MTKSQITTFIRRFTKKTFLIKFVKPTKHFKRLKNFMAQAGLNKPLIEMLFNIPTKYNVIFINNREWEKATTNYQKYTILHEIGHFMTTYNPNNQIQAEINATIWMINKTKHNKELYEIALTHTKDWQYYEWNSEHRKYRIAYKSLKQQGII